MHWIHTSFQGRWGQASPRIVDDILLLLSFSFFLSVYLFRSFFSHCMIRLCLLILCVQTAAATAGFSSVFYYSVSSLFLYITPNIYNTTSVLSRSSFFSFSLIFFKKNQYWLTDCFFLWDFLCVYVSLFRLLLLLQPSCSDYNMYVCMYICAYVWKEEREEKHADERRKKKETENGTSTIIMVISIIIVVLNAKSYCFYK
jgi:hypothetical protein